MGYTWTPSIIVTLIKRPPACEAASRAVTSPRRPHSLTKLLLLSSMPSRHVASMQTMKSWFSNSANEIANSAVWVGCVYSVRQLDLKTKKK